MHAVGRTRVDDMHAVGRTHFEKQKTARRRSTDRGDRPTADDDDDDGWMASSVGSASSSLCRNSPDEAVTTHLDSTLARLEN